MRIVTVTPNPGLDLTYRLPGGLSGAVEVHRASSATLEASGKGVNVSRALRSAGLSTVAVLFSAGATGRQLVDLLDGEDVAHRAVAQSGVTRVNTSILSEGGSTVDSTVKVNAPGTAMTQGDFDNLVFTLSDEIATGEPGWVLICGSLPPTSLIIEDVVSHLVTAAHAAGWRVAVDSSGEALVAAANAGADLLTPNAEELSALAPASRTTLAGATPPTSAARGTRTGGREGAGVVLSTPEAIGDRAAEVARARGCELLVSLGADGALWTDGTRIVQARGEAVVPVNTAGAGDALLSGWFTQPDEAVAERLATAVRWGAAACLAPTTVRIPAAPEPGSAVATSEIGISEREYPTAAPS